MMKTLEFSTKVASKHYETKLPYPTRVVKPFLKREASVKEAEQYVLDLKLYEAQKKSYDAQYKSYQEDNQKFQLQFKTDLFAELGITDNLKRETLYSLAYDYGHSAGLYEIYIHAEKLVELI